MGGPGVCPPHLIPCQKVHAIHDLPQQKRPQIPGFRGQQEGCHILPTLHDLSGASSCETGTLVTTQQ